MIICNSQNGTKLQLKIHGNIRKGITNSEVWKVFTTTIKNINKSIKKLKIPSQQKQKLYFSLTQTNLFIKYVDY